VSACVARLCEPWQTTLGTICEKTRDVRTLRCSVLIGAMLCAHSRSGGTPGRYSERAWSSQVCRRFDCGTILRDHALLQSLQGVPPDPTSTRRGDRLEPSASSRNVMLVQGSCPRPRFHFESFAELAMPSRSGRALRADWGVTGTPGEASTFITGRFIRYGLILLVGLCLLWATPAQATWQIPRLIEFGNHTYGLEEIPMLGLWDYGPGSIGPGTQKPPPFEMTSSANNSGYVAQFGIRDSKLYLDKITGQIDGKTRRNEQIIPGPQFPIVAEWFTGRIHVQVGEYDNERRESNAVIIFHVEKGIVRKTDFAERMTLPGTWNGLPAPTGPKAE